MLLGRDPERRALDRLLAEARLGQSGVLAVVGEPGIGKSALLAYAAQRAEGMAILRAQGVESEAEVPFSGLLELLRPALGALRDIPPPQAVALEGALALRPSEAKDRFAVGAGTLSLLAAHADAAPTLVIVDDAHWIDGSSAEAILFAARRLVADPIAVVLAVREGEPSLVDAAGLPVLHVRGLDRTAAAALLARERDAPLPPDVVESLHRATAGNPLALIEVAGDAERVAGGPVGAPVPISARIADGFLRRSGKLGAGTRRMLVLAAVSDSGDLGLLGRAAASLGVAVGDLAEAETAGLVRVEDGTVAFRHALVRSAVYREADPAERRESHRALADALPDRDVDRRAWHLASACVGPDDAAAAALEQAGSRARERSAYVAAATAFERAARLSEEDARRGTLLYTAAESAWLAGQPGRALGLLDDSRECAPAGLLAARIDHLRGHLIMRRGPVMDGHAILAAAAGDPALEGDPELASTMLADCVNACFYAGAVTEMRETARRAVDLLPADPSDRAEFLATMGHGMALIMTGGGEEGAAWIRRAVEILEGSADLQRDPRLLAWAAMGPLWLREDADSRRLIDRALTVAREQAAVGVLPYLLHHVARDHATSDRWRVASAGFHEAIRLARETGQRAELGAALAGLAWLEARQGREDECRAHAEEAQRICSELGAQIYRIWAIAALGDLELGLSRPSDAVSHLEEQKASLSALGVADVDLFPSPELVDAYLRLGDADAAAVAAAEFELLAIAKRQPWALARAERCRGLLASDAELDGVFGRALELHAQTPDLFETARTQLAYGARLRRARRRIDAREQLRAAVGIFDRLGASPWADQARTELGATGETARQRDPSTLDELTPQELQVAVLLAGGKTTREAAAALFLSPKTVEYHLRHVYRKLGIGSRAELAASMRDPHDSG